ncbi:hypothetical protein K439DRAFT_1617374 [Ramaria rubella]|nr:hypothetical protein K439DRAFT_1617374 [Ramaria rubella]
MSSQEEIPALIQEVADVGFSAAFSYVYPAAFVLLAYDTLLTLPREIKHIWHNKLRLGSILYLLARYSTLFILVLDVYLQFAPDISTQCLIGSRKSNILEGVANACSLFPLIGIAGLLLARAYAISGRSRGVLVVPAFLAFTGMALNLAKIDPNFLDIETYFWFVVQPHSYYSLLICVPFLRKIIHDFPLRLVDTVIDIALILFETFIFFVVLMHTVGLPMLRKGMKVQHRDYTLTGLIIYQVSIAQAITEKALRTTLQGILGAIQNAFVFFSLNHLNAVVNQRIEHLNGSTSSHTPHVSIGSFHAVAGRIHQAVMEEFGEPGDDELYDIEAQPQHRATVRSLNLSGGVGLEDFYLASDKIGNEKTPSTDPNNSGSLNICIPEYGP